MNEYLDSINWKEKCNEVFIPETLAKLIKDIVKQVAREEWSEEGLLITTLVSGSFGTHIPSALYDILQLDQMEVCYSELEEWYWEEFMDVTRRFTDGFNEWLKDELKIDLPYHSFWIGTWESDGSLCLIVNEDWGFRDDIMIGEKTSDGKLAFISKEFAQFCWDYDVCEVFGIDDEEQESLINEVSDFDRWETVCREV